MMRQDCLLSKSKTAVTYKTVQLYCGRVYQKGVVSRAKLRWQDQTAECIRLLRYTPPPVWSFLLNKQNQWSISYSTECEPNELWGEKRMSHFPPALPPILPYKELITLQEEKGREENIDLEAYSLKLIAKIIQSMSHPFFGQDWMNYSAYSNHH